MRKRVGVMGPPTGVEEEGACLRRSHARGLTRRISRAAVIVAAQPAEANGWCLRGLPELAREATIHHTVDTPPLQRRDHRVLGRSVLRLASSLFVMTVAVAPLAAQDSTFLLSTTDPTYRIPAFIG